MILIWLCPDYLTAQQIINTSGNSVVMEGNTYAYSIGEMIAVDTRKVDDLIVTQGVLQSSASQLNTHDYKMEEFTVFPNPTSGLLDITSSALLPGILKLTLYDMTGRQVQSASVPPKKLKEHFEMDLRKLAAGTYILKAVYADNQRQFVENFKISKL